MGSGRPPRKHAVVVGGGIAGLSAAVALGRAGVEVTVVEAGAVAGGRLSTPGRFEFTWAGEPFSFPIEHGVHGIWRRYRNLRRLIEWCGLDHHLRDPGPQEMITLMPGTDRIHPVEVARLVQWSRIPAPFAQMKPWLDPTLFRAVVQHGPRGLLSLASGWHFLAYDTASDADMAAYDAVSVSDLTAAWPPAFRAQFEALSHSGYFDETGAISLATFCLGFAFYVTDDRRDAYFDVFDTDAHEALVGPVCAAIRTLGGHLRLGTRVEALRWTGQDATSRASGVTVVTPEGRREEIAADAVVLALDPPALRQLSQGTPAEAPGLGGASTRGLPSMAVRLWFTRAPPDDRAASGMLANLDADNFFWLHRWQAPFQAWHARTGGGVLECHLYGHHATRAQIETDEEAIDRVRAMAERVWPGLAGSFAIGHLQRNAATHVSFHPGAMRALPPVRSSVANVARAGDGIACEHAVLYLERACLTGTLAAREVLPALGIPIARVPEPLAPEPAERTVVYARRAARVLRRAGLLTPLRPGVPTAPNVAEGRE
ncbi:MAG: FAD-dependent oxidoreductase [Pseudomonadota bacterium]|nr:FAD-dependent oxidoreductase [Pseudomonadota bacterium]